MLPAPRPNPMKRHVLCKEPRLKLLEPGEDGAGEYGSLSGYASTFGNADRVGDIILEGAFTGTIDSFLKNGFVAIGHNWRGLPVATPAEAREDGYGLWTRCDFHGTEEAQTARRVCKERIERGKSVGLSIGFDIKEYSPIDPKRPWGAWKIREVELFEYSIVTVPCNPRATVSDAKGALLDGVTFADHLETLLADVEGFITRAGDLREMRGRGFSDDRREQFEGLHAHLLHLADSLQSMTRVPGPDVKSVLQARADFERIRASVLGVPVGA